MYFYKKSNGKWQIGVFEIPAGKCLTATSKVTGAISIELIGSYQVCNNVLPTEFQDINGNYYADFAAYELATSDFFVDAALAAAEQLAVNDNGLSELSGNGIDATSLLFKLKKTYNKKFYTLDTFSTIFDNPSDDELLFSKIDSSVATQISTGKMVFSAGVADAQTFFTTPFTFDAAGYYVQCTVLQDKPNTWYNLPRVGIAKDINNYIFGNVDKNNSKASFVCCQNGTINEYGITSIDRDLFTVPYNLIFAVNGFTAYLIWEQNGVYKTLTSWTQTNYFNFGGVANGNLTNYKASIGGRTTVGNGDLTITGFKCGYYSGMSIGADFKPITFEDGSLIQDGNSIYLTSSSHSTDSVNGTGGGNIFKINISNYTIEFVGKIFQSRGGNNFGGASYKVFYDRNINKWIVSASNFDFDQFKINIGITEENLLSGIHVVQMENTPLSGDAWDSDIIFKDSKYLMTYNRSDGNVVLSESSDLINWTDKLVKSMSGEGNVFSRVNGKQCILRAITINEITVLDLNLNTLGVLNTNKWSTLSGVTTPCWGFIAPFCYGNKTSYYLINFSMSLWENKKYTYGGLWIFKADQIANGVEFKRYKKNIISQS